MQIVLLHALPFDGSVWNDMSAELGTDTVAPTLYGLGASIEDWATAVLDLAGDDPLVVVGNSVGGSCALEVAQLAPHRVAALVLVGAKAAHRPEPQLRDDAIRLLREGGMAEAWPKYWEPLFGVAAAPGVVADARRVAFAQDVDDVIRGVRVFHEREDRSDFVRAWTKPLVVVRGDRDDTPPHAAAAQLASAAPAGELHVIEGSGHYVGLERPSELAAIIQRVVRDVTRR